MRLFQSPENAPKAFQAFAGLAALPIVALGMLFEGLVEVWDFIASAFELGRRRYKGD